MAVMKGYDDVVAQIDNLPDYCVCYPTRYQKEKYAHVPKNRKNCPRQAPGSEYFIDQYYMKDHRR